MSANSYADSLFNVAVAQQSKRDKHDDPAAHRSYVAATVEYAKVTGITVEEAARKVTEANR